MAKRYHGEKHAKSASHMIAEDHSAPCLLPKGVIEKDFGGRTYAMPKTQIADLSTGVERQLEEDSSDMKKAFGPAKY